MLLKPALSIIYTNNMSGQVYEVPIYQTDPVTGNKQSGKFIQGLCPNPFIFQGKIRQLTLVIMQLRNLKIAFSLKARSPKREIEKLVNR